MDGIKTRREHIRKRALITIRMISITGLHGEKRDYAQARFVGLNMSVNGLGLETLFELKIGETLELQFTLTDLKPITATTVIRSIATEKRDKHVVYRAGVEFTQISEADRKVVSSYVSNLGVLV